MLRLAQMVKELASAERLAARAGAENHGACVCLILPYVGAWMSGVGMSWPVVKRRFRGPPWSLWDTLTKVLRHLARQLLCDIGRERVLLLRVFLLIAGGGHKSFAATGEGRLCGRDRT